jgi:hypothetical protein
MDNYLLTASQPDAARSNNPNQFLRHPGATFLWRREIAGLLVAIAMFLSHLQWLQGVEIEAAKVVSQVEHHDDGDEPVVVVDPAPVDVVLEPVPAAPRGALHHRDEHRAQVTPEGAAEPEERDGRAAHALRRLVVQELHLPHRREGVGDAVDGVLRHQPEHAHRDDGLGGVQEPVLRRLARRLVSTSAAAATPKTAMVSPMPMRWK